MEAPQPTYTPSRPDLGSIVKALVSLVSIVLICVILWQVFAFLRMNTLPKWQTATVAVVAGIGGVGALFAAVNGLIEQLPLWWSKHLLPYMFVGPAVFMLIAYLALPAVRTIYLSFFNSNSQEFVGLNNFMYVFTNHTMLQAFRNNVLWLVLGTGLSVSFGLLIAVLADRTDPQFETVIKSIIFLPWTVSLVGAGLIWMFMYAYRPPGSVQIGLLNAIVTALGQEPQAWLFNQPWNNLFLIAIMVWFQTGYAMVILSAAIKGIPAELLEAGRIDGADEFQLFFRITVPYIGGTIIVVATTITILALKVFDIVFTMTGGNFGTEVIANQFYVQMFKSFQVGRGAAIATVLLILVIPVMWYNLRHFTRQTEAF